MESGLINNQLFETIVINIVKVVLGFIVLIICFKIINLISKKIKNRLNSNEKVDETISSFIAPLISKGLKFFVIVCYIGFIGIETSSIAAAITSAGLAIGLAMQGSLSNFAGGFVILIMRPFKVGDYIETCGESGTVESIEIFYTTLVTPDYRVIKIPNGEVASSIIIDTSTKQIRRVDLFISISYKQDVDKIKDIIKKSVNNLEYPLVKKDIFININEYKPNYLILEVRFWVKTKDYWSAYYNILERLYNDFLNEGVDMSYSMIDVNVTNKNV